MNLSYSFDILIYCFICVKPFSTPRALKMGRHELLPSFGVMADVAFGGGAVWDFALY